MQTYYEKCIEEAERAKSSRFIRSCTFFDLLRKCHCQIAPHMRNPEFEAEFKKFKVKEFPMYAGDAVRAFKRAEEHYQSILEFEELINRTCEISNVVVKY
ncbi:hypothetical protein TSAR_014036 [Trichomalopsis sarcophagae]|uniref:Uncharacterized protein n=1 Tax=Trichomalopsis sarcophagae TaxID=543379 RepID=A0A232EV19_9HYME|nr:hypothetical protein TSAR_014036 [Trichomalopsis sarcophagae]